MSEYQTSGSGVLATKFLENVRTILERYPWVEIQAIVDRVNIVDPERFEMRVQTADLKQGIITVEILDTKDDAVRFVIQENTGSWAASDLPNYFDININPRDDVTVPTADIDSDEQQFRNWVRFEGTDEYFGVGSFAKLLQHTLPEDVHTAFERNHLKELIRDFPAPERLSLAQRYRQRGTLSPREAAIYGAHQ